MRLLKYIFIGAMLLPQLAFAYTPSLTATTTTGTIFAYPTKVNGIDPAVMSPFFFGTSSATTTLMGPFFDLYTMAHFGSTTCSTGGLALSSGFLQGLEYCGNDNTDTGGVQIIEDNNANGASSWGGFTLNNDLADNTLTHFSGLYFNSSKYTSTAFGQIFGNANQLTLQNTDGPVTILASTGTSAGYITFNTGSTASSSERVRILSNGNFGIATTSPGSRFSVQGDEFIAGRIFSTSTAASVFPYASSTALNSGAWFGGGLAVCSGSNFLQYTATTGQFSCGASSGSFAYPFTYNLLNTFSTSTNSTSTSYWTQGVYFASSTKAASQFPYASSSALTAGNLFASQMTLTLGSQSASSLVACNGATVACSGVGVSTDGTVVQSSGSGSSFTVAALNLATAASITGILPIANGGTGGTSAPFSFNRLNTFSTTTFSTSSSLWTQGVFFSSSTVAASQFPYASSTMLSMTTASTTNLIVSSAGTGSTKCAQVAADGTVSATGSACAGSFAFPFTTNAVTVFWNAITNSTTTQMHFSGTPISLSASSTSQFDYSTTTALSVSQNTYLAVNSGAVGIASTTPWGLLSINPNALPAGSPAFVIGSSSPNGFFGTLFGINQSGGVFLPTATTSTSTSITLNWPATGQTVHYNIGTVATAINVVNATTTLYSGSVKRVMICNGAVTAGALTFTGVEWFGGAAPTQTTTANVCDLYQFFVDAGTSTQATNSTPTYKVFGSQIANAQ